MCAYDYGDERSVATKIINLIRKSIKNRNNRFRFRSPFRKMRFKLGSNLEAKFSLHLDSTVSVSSVAHLRCSQVSAAKDSTCVESRAWFGDTLVKCPHFSDWVFKKESNTNEGGKGAGQDTRRLFVQTFSGWFYKWMRKTRTFRCAWIGICRHVWNEWEVESDRQKRLCEKTSKPPHPFCSTLFQTRGMRWALKTH